jgi:hypothetical protein
LGSWAGVKALSLGAPASTPAPLTLESSIFMRCRPKSRLVLRSSPEFAMELAYQATGDPHAKEFWADAFREFCNLVAADMSCFCFGQDEGEFFDFQPLSSVPGQWPASAPQAAALLSVQGHLIEARYWGAEDGR